MNVRVVEPGDAAWTAAVERLDADVYHLAAYHRVAARNGEGRPLAFLVEHDGALLFHPFLQRPIERVACVDVSSRGWSDVETVYGYSGPLATTRDATFLTNAWRAFHEWCERELVVAEFVRFDPLLDNASLADPAMSVAVDRETVVVDLAAELWPSYPSVQRNMVRKAEASGLAADVVPAREAIDDFCELYGETMARVGADDYFAFPPSYFEALLDELPVQAVRVTSAGELGAAALLLQHGERLHYHLSGSREWAQRVGATNLLLHAAAEWGKAEGLRTFHLGGGRTPSPDDSLLRFKASVSRGRAQFSTGRRVHVEAAYRELCDLWLGQASGPRPPYFLLYRLELH